MTSPNSRFPFRFTGVNKAMAVLGLNPRSCYAEVTDDELVVRFGWAFRCRVPRSSITAVGDDHAPVRGWGAHGWRHVWLVNGTSSGLVRIEIEPMARGWVTGFPLRVRALRIGVEHPDDLRALLVNVD
jgi:hypothetical protein